MNEDHDGNMEHELNGPQMDTSFRDDDGFITDTSLAERRTRRVIRPPARFINLVDAETYHPLPKNLPTKEIIKIFLMTEVEIEPLDSADEPTLKEAMKSRDWDQWEAAIHMELASLKAMEVYEEVDDLPLGKKAVGSKWVLLKKRDENGEISKYKARLVAQGFTQIPGQDYTHTFAPVARWDSIRHLLCLAAIFDWELHHIDIKTAYLNGDRKSVV